MGLSPITAVRSLATLVVAALAVSACATAPAADALSSSGGAPAAAAAPTRTVALTGIRTTDYTRGTLQVTGRLTPAPAQGTRVALQRWSPTLKRWEEVGHSRSNGVNVTLTTTQPGSIRSYRVAIGPQAPYAAAGSPGRTFQHFVWRGVFKRAVLATGGKGHPEFTVVPPGEDPGRTGAELLADPKGQVWGDLDTTGCTWAKTWLGNLTDGTVRTSLLSGAKVLGSVDEKQETETWLNRRLLGSTRTRLQVTDLRSGYGPNVAADVFVLCAN